MRFYYMCNGDKFKNAWWSDDMDFEGSILCSKYPSHQRPGRRKNPLRIKFESSKIGDFIWTWYSECVITENIANLFKEAGFTGYRLEPLIVTGVKGGDISSLPKMWEFKVTGKGGNICKLNQIKIKKECECCKHIVYSDFKRGLHLDESLIDGSDFFTVWPLPMFIITTEKVKNFIEKNEISNVKLIPLEDLEGEGEEGSLSPGNYEDWLNNIR